MTTYEQYLATKMDGWDIDSAQAIRLLQTIWDYVYGERIPHEVHSEEAVFYVVSTRSSLHKFDVT